MILVDTSAWIEFLGDTGSPVCDLVDELLEREVAICDPVWMEVFSGAPVLHNHADFAVLARHTELRIYEAEDR